MNNRAKISVPLATYQATVCGDCEDYQGFERGMVAEEGKVKNNFNPLI